MNRKFYTVPAQGGYVVIVNTLIFLVISLFVVFAIAVPLIAGNSASNTLLSSKKAFITANSAMEETLYKMKNQMNVGSSEVLTLASTTATVSVASTFGGKVITVTSSENDAERNIRAVVTETVGTSFSYGLQSGKGGFRMSGNAGINGNVYSNGDIVGDGGPFITGSATVANGTDPVAEQSNGNGTPAYDVMFGGELMPSDPKPEDFAQSFTVSTTTPVSSIRLYIKKYADESMNNATVRITNDKSGHPDKTTLTSGILSANQVTTSYNYLLIPFSSAPSLNPGTTYWLVVDTVHTSGSYYILGANDDGYANGEIQLGEWSQSGSGGTWNDASPANLDAFFDLYVGGEMGSISGVTIGEAGVGDAWAHEVNNTTIAGMLYCQESANTNKPCDTSRPDPVPQPFPVSDGNISAWKAEGANGGTTVGDLTFESSEVASLGPQKIEGDLSVGSGAIVNITGTLYVTGNISVSGGGIIKLASSYGDSSGVIVTDGMITTSGGGTFEGSGFSGSYILVVTTSTCPEGPCNGNPAVKITGGAGAVVMNAQKGTVEFSGGAHAKQVTADTIVMSGGTIVDYETGLADINFSSGPSGSWGVVEWDEI